MLCLGTEEATDLRNLQASDDPQHALSQYPGARLTWRGCFSSSYFAGRACPSNIIHAHLPAKEGHFACPDMQVLTAETLALQY